MAILGSTTITDLSVSNNATVSGNLNVNGETTINNTLYVTGTHNVCTDNGYGFYVKDTSGNYRTLGVLNSSNYLLCTGGFTNNVQLGNYSYTTKTDIQGKDISFHIGSTELVPYFKKGDSVSIKMYTSGYLSSGSTTIYFTIPLSKPVINASASITSTGGFVLRQNGNYTHGSTSSTGAIPTSTQCEVTQNEILCSAVFSNTSNAQNNSAIGIYFSGTLTFS